MVRRRPSSASQPISTYYQDTMSSQQHLGFLQSMRNGIFNKAFSDAFTDQEGRIISPTPRLKIEGEILARSRTLLQKPFHHYSLLWVNGPAGVGKTTLIRSIAEGILRKPSPITDSSAQPIDTAPKTIGACFFLTHNNRPTNSSNLIEDLARDLARRNSGFASLIRNALSTIGRTRHLSLKEQCDILLVEPIRKWAQRTNKDHDIIMVVDGLDACEDGNSEHLNIINVIHQSFSSLLIDHVRWQWIISSRSEAWIRSAFDELSPDPRVQCISIPLASQQEMMEYIHRSIQGRTGRGLDQELDNIRWHSAGYFAYTASLIAYINKPTGSAHDHFHEIVSHTEHATFKHKSDHMFTQLDTMYHDILAQVPLPLRELTQRVLGAMSLMQISSSNERNPSAFMLSELLGIHAEELYHALYHLHSVVAAPLKPSHDSQLTFHHKSFNEFLRNPTRSWEWCIDIPAVHADLAKCCLNQLATQTGWSNHAYEYAAKRWFVHCWRTGMSSDTPNEVEVALGLLPELYEFDYTCLPRNEQVDRYFVEWLLWLQDLTMSDYLVLNPGPRHSLEIPIPYPPHPSPYHTAHPPPPVPRTRKLPPTPTYVLGFDPARQVLLASTFELKTGQTDDDTHMEILGPRKKGWDCIRGFTIVPLMEAINEVGSDLRTTEGGQEESHDRSSVISTAVEQRMNLGTISGGLDYDELVARSLALEEENGGFDAATFGGFVSSDEEMAALIAALNVTEGTALGANIISNEEGKAPRDVTTEAAAAAEDNATTPAARDTPADEASDNGTEGYVSVGSSTTDLEDVVFVTSQTGTEVEDTEDGDSEFELVDYEEARR